tara:strand:+ start:339 stop:707 length:369 start_codon:yes stop_codon:yes gene_type:complete
MKTPKELKSIFDKFPKEKIELEKVELGSLDEIEDAVKIFKNVAQLESNVVTSIAKALQEYKSVVGKAEKIVSISEKLTNKVKSQAKELGVDPKEIGKYNVLQNFIKSQNDIEQRYKKALNAL